MQRHDGLAGAGAALHDQQAGQLGADDLVLLALDGGDDVGEPSGASRLDGGEQRAAAGELVPRAVTVGVAGLELQRRSPNSSSSMPSSWRPLVAKCRRRASPSARARWPGRRARPPAPASPRPPAPGPRRTPPGARCRRSRRRRRCSAARSMRPNTRLASPSSSSRRRVTIVSQITSRSNRACSVPPRPTSTMEPRLAARRRAASRHS